MGAMLRPDNAATNEDHCAGLLYSTVQHSTTVQYSVLMRIIVQVSWIQKSSLHVLTSSVITFTGTPEFNFNLDRYAPIFGECNQTSIPQGTIGSAACTARSPTPGPCRSATRSCGTWASTSARSTPSPRYQCQSFFMSQVSPACNTSAVFCSLKA